MAFTAGTPLGAAALNDATGLTTETAFTTSSPAGSGWYRKTAGGMIEVHYESSGTVASQTAVTLTVLPAGYRPSGLTPIAASSATTRPAASEIAADGTWTIYNWNNSSQTVRAHGTYLAA